MKIIHWLFLLGLWACGGKTHTNSPVPLIIVDSNFLEKQVKVSVPILEINGDCSDSSFLYSLAGKAALSFIMQLDSFPNEELFPNYFMYPPVSIWEKSLICKNICYANEKQKKIKIETFQANKSNGLNIHFSLSWRSNCKDNDALDKQSIHLNIFPTNSTKEQIVVFSSGTGAWIESELTIYAYKWNRETGKWKLYNKYLPQIQTSLFFEKKKSKVFLKQAENYISCYISDTTMFLELYFEELKYCYWKDEKNIEGDIFSLLYKWDKNKEQFIYHSRKKVDKQL